MSFRFAIVDDAPFIREILRTLSEQLGGVCVGEAESARGALDLIKKTLPDVLFLDLVMPEKNGIELIPQIFEVWPEVYLIVCSTLDQEEILKKVKMAGAHAFISKPFNKEKIAESLRAFSTKKKES